MIVIGINESLPYYEKNEGIITSRLRALNPLSRIDIQLFKAMIAGENHIRGLSNADIRMCLQGSMHLQDLADHPRKQGARRRRILSRFLVTVA